MIPVSLYGVNVEMADAFYTALPGLVADSVDDEPYQKALFSIETEASLEHIRIADQWASHQPFAWPEDISNEVEMTLRTTTYPDVSMLEHLLTLDNIDAQRVSEWMHFSTNLFPIYSEAACATPHTNGHSHTLPPSRHSLLRALCVPPRGVETLRSSSRTPRNWSTPLTHAPTWFGAV